MLRNPNNAFMYLFRGFKPMASRCGQRVPVQSMSSLMRKASPSLSLFSQSPTAGFDDFFSPTLLRDPFFNFMPVIRNFERDANMVLSRSSPGYEINEDDDKYQIAIDVPGVKASDLDVVIEQDGRVLRLSGDRKIQKGNNISETKFEKRFWIGENVDTSNLTANLSDGVLVVTAAKKPEEPEKTVKVAITEGLSESK